MTINPRIDMSTTTQELDYATYDTLRGMLHGFDEKTDVVDAPEDSGLATQCWIWAGGAKVAFTREDGVRTNARIDGLSYDTAFPEHIDRRNGRRLTLVCGVQDCFCPDHLTDKAWGFWEDLKFLVDSGTNPLDIPERLGHTPQSLSHYIAGMKITPERAAVRRRFSIARAEHLEALAFQIEGKDIDKSRRTASHASRLRRLAEVA